MKLQLMQLFNIMWWCWSFRLFKAITYFYYTEECGMIQILAYRRAKKITFEEYKKIKINDMTTQQFINENRTETFKKGDKVIMQNCYEATFEKYKNKIWICKTDSYLDKSKEEVVFLEDFSGCFLVKYLKLNKQ